MPTRTDVGPSTAKPPAKARQFRAQLTAADGAGSASFTFALPFAAAWAGATFRAQWLVLDPAGPASIGGLPFSVTDTRRVVLW
jgi:hypothetical protein